MEITSLVTALAPAFASGFALQRLLEILDPILDKIGKVGNKRIVLGLISLLSGFGLARGLHLGVLSNLVADKSLVPDLLDFLVTSLIISGGTEGFNAIMKFMSYKKEETKATAITAMKTAERPQGLIDMEDSAMTSNECIDWRRGEFRQRVRRAVAEWAQEPVESILPTATLGQLAKGTPWNAGQQARLVQSVNSQQAFAPHFPNSRMRPPSQVVPAATTVEEWESVAWKHQDPITMCLAFTS